MHPPAQDRRRSSALLLSLALVGVILVGLAACGEKGGGAITSQPSPTVATASPEPETVTSAETGFGLWLPVLMYHHVRDGVPPSDKAATSFSVHRANFEEQMRYLSANGYYTVTPLDLYSALKNNTALPPKAVILTFDDGYLDFYTNAYPVLKEYGFRSTVFMIADFVGLDGYLTGDQLKEMQAGGLVDVESHTLSHPHLPSLSLEKAREEIVSSRFSLGALLGKPVTVFCYPYGDYNADIVKLVVEAGYSLAFGTRDSQFENGAQMFYLPRVKIDGLDSLSVFSQKVDDTFSR